jgi:hypothetical protein
MEIKYALLIINFISISFYINFKIARVKMAERGYKIFPYKKPRRKVLLKS